MSLDLLTPEDAAQILRVPVRTVVQLCACAVLVEEHVVEDCYYDNSDSDARMTLSSAAAAIRARSGK